ncbi:MAG: ATP-binding protein [Mariprofundus sp.]
MNALKKNDHSGIFQQLNARQLIVGLLAVIVTTATFYSVSRDLAQGLEDDLRTAFDQQNLTVVDIASSRVGFHIDNDVAENVRLLGQFPAMQRQELHNGTRDMEKVNTFAAPRVDGFVLFGPDGNLFTNYPESMRYIYKGNHADADYFKVPKETSNLYFSDWVHEGNHLKMRVSSPVYNRIIDKNFPPPTDSFSGVIMAQIDFDRTIATELGRLQANGLMHWIVDENSGDVLFHSVLPRVQAKNSVDSDKTTLAKSLLKAFPSTVLAPGIHRTIIHGKGFTVASARSKIGPHSIMVNLAYDDSAVSGLVREKTNRIYLLGLGFLVMVVIGAVVTLRQMAKRHTLISEKDHLSRELALEEEKKKLSEQVFQLQKMESLGELAAGTAHELNNALSGPMGMLSIIQMKPDMPMEKRADMLAKSISGMEQARSIVEGLLRFSKSERNEKVLDDINEDIRFVLNMYKKELDQAGIRLNQHLDPALPPIHAAHRQIQQILLNLVVNARYVLDQNGILTVSSVRQQRDGVDGILVSVQDNGPGMDEDTQKRIFEPFFSTKPTGEGTGLGLSICYGIINDHHGVMDVESKPGQGAAFRIWLPVTQGATS